MASCSSSYTEFKREYYSKPRATTTSGYAKRESSSKTRLYSTSSYEKELTSTARTKDYNVSKDVGHNATSLNTDPYESMVLAENCRMDNEVTRLRDIVRSVEYKFQTVQSDLMNLSVELKKFRNLNKVYKRALKRQYEINQRMHWRNFETEQENETLRQLVRNMKASRQEMESEFASRYIAPPSIDYAAAICSKNRNRTTSRSKSPDLTSKASRGYSSYFDTPSSRYESTSYQPRRSGSTSYRIERTSSSTQRDYDAGKSTSFNYEKKKTANSEYGIGGNSSKRSTYRISSYTRLD